MFSAGVNLSFPIEITINELNARLSQTIKIKFFENMSYFILEYNLWNITMSVSSAKKYSSKIY